MDLSTPELLNEWKGSFLLDIHTAMPGIVTSYNASKQTAEVQPAVQRQLDGEFETLPIIPNVPVAWLSGAGRALVLDLEPGDNVFLIFSETAWAQYRESRRVSRPGDLTRHSMSYPIALPFSLSAIGGSGPRLVTSTPLSVGDSATAKLVAVADKVATWLATHTHTSGGSGSPTSPPIQPVSEAQLAATKLKAS